LDNEKIPSRASFESPDLFIDVRKEMNKEKINDSSDDPVKYQ